MASEFKKQNKNKKLNREFTNFFFTITISQKKMLLVPIFFRYRLRFRFNKHITFIRAHGVFWCPPSSVFKIEVPENSCWSWHLNLVCCFLCALLTYIHLLPISQPKVELISKPALIRIFKSVSRQHLNFEISFFSWFLLSKWVFDNAYVLLNILEF